MPRSLFQNLINDLAALEATEVEIRATGEYPTKRRTKVAAVAMYQNDGTERIKPSRFVERAAGRWRNWRRPVFDAVSEILFRNGNIRQELEQAGLRISEDVAYVCDRIRTGRLKKSFRPIVIKGHSTSLFTR